MSEILYSTDNCLWSGYRRQRPRPDLDTHTVAIYWTGSSDIGRLGQITGCQKKQRGDRTCIGSELLFPLEAVPNHSREPI
jgi:hypothetical protein